MYVLLKVRNLMPTEKDIWLTMMTILYHCGLLVMVIILLSHQPSIVLADTLTPTAAPTSVNLSTYFPTMHHNTTHNTTTTKIDDRGRFHLTKSGLVAVVVAPAALIIVFFYVKSLY